MEGLNGYDVATSIVEGQKEGDKVKAEKFLKENERIAERIGDNTNPFNKWVAKGEELEEKYLSGF